MSYMDIERERIIELCLKYGDPEVAEMLQEDAIEDALVQGVPPSSLPPSTDASRDSRISSGPRRMSQGSRSGDETRLVNGRLLAEVPALVSATLLR